MRTMQRAAIAALVLLVAGCATTGMVPPPPPPNSVARQCERSEGLYEGYRLSCKALAQRKKPCKQDDEREQLSVRGQAIEFCGRSPADTEANRATIKQLVDRQRSIGRAKQ